MKFVRSNTLLSRFRTCGELFCVAHY